MFELLWSGCLCVGLCVCVVPVSPFKMTVRLYVITVTQAYVCITQILMCAGPLVRL